MIRRVLLRQLKDYVRTFIRPVNSMSGAELVDLPAGQRVLVLSPHFDDDVIGCGGTLRKHVQAGHPVTIAYLTDGREGDASIADKNLVSTLRKQEATRATALLGISDLVFLDGPETRLTAGEALVKALADVVARVNPDVIYLPWFLDNHIDHFETNRILYRLRDEVPSSTVVVAYEVWMPLVPNVLVDISEVADLKRRALSEYVTQVRQIDYVEITLGLNKYRAAFGLGGRGYAEAFFAAPIAEYIAAIEALDLPSRLYITRPTV